MLALSVQIGDVAVRTDLGKSFILKATPATQLANWQEILTPESPVQSVNGKTGTVTLTASDVGAEPVLNNKSAKGAVVDNDGIVILDSAASNGTKKLLWSVVKSTLKTYFDALYNKYTLPTASADIKGGAKIGAGLKMSGEVLSVGDIDGGTF